MVSVVKWSTHQSVELAIAGSSPVAYPYTPIYQLEDCVSTKDEVGGSNPSGCSINKEVEYVKKCGKDCGWNGPL